MRDFHEPYELAYYKECDKNDKLRREVFGIEEERDIVIMQLHNWQKLCQEKLLPKQITWCDLCEYAEYKDDNICGKCTMGSEFEYCESLFGNLNKEFITNKNQSEEEIICAISKLQKQFNEVR
jgi:hypothetical protein